MRFKGLDLNLIFTLEILLEERSVSAAARRLHLSQPATSAALARLREFFQDDILVVLGKTMYPTPFAEGLRLQVREFLAAAENIIAATAVFEPESAQRTFKIITSDSLTSSIFVPLMDRLSVTAPGVGFDFIFPDNYAHAQFHRGDIDLMISPEGFAFEEYPTELFFEEPHVIAGWRENTIFESDITEEAIFTRGHVAVALGAARTPSFADRQIELLGRQRKIEVTVAAFTQAPLFLVGSQRLSIMHQRLAATMSLQFPIAYAPLPFPFAPLRQMIRHHGSRSSDEGVRWLLGELHQQKEKLNPSN